MKRDQLLVVGILVFIAALFLLAFYLPNTAELRQMKATLMKDREELTQRQKTAQTLPQLASEVRALRERVSDLDTQLPADQQLDQFLKSLTVHMAAESLELLAVKPEAIQKGEALDQLPIHVGFRGSFTGTCRFLRRLESMPRIARVDQLQLAVSDGTGSGQLSGTMRLCIFVLRRSALKGASKDDGVGRGTGGGKVEVHGGHTAWAVTG